MASEMRRKKLPMHRSEAARNQVWCWMMQKKGRLGVVVLVAGQVVLLVLLMRSLRVLGGKKTSRREAMVELPCKYNVDGQTEAILVQQEAYRPCLLDVSAGRELSQDEKAEPLWTLQDATARQVEDNICRTPLAGNEDQGKITIVVPVAEKDVERALLLKKSLRKFFDMESLERIYVICPDREVGRISLLFADEKTTVMGEDQLFTNGELFLDMEHAQYLVQKGNRVLNEGGWVRQQAVKLAAAHMVETEFYIVLDSDNIAIRPMAYHDFVRDGRAVVNFDADMRRNGQFKEWWRWARDLLGVSLWNATYGVTPGVMNTNVVQQMLEYIEYRYGQRWTQVLLGGKLPWTEWGLYYTFAEASGMFESTHYACEGALYSYVVWARINYQDFDITSLFSQSYSLFTIVQSIGDISVYTVSQDFEPYIHSSNSLDRLDQDDSWSLMRRLRDTAEDNATRRHKHRSDHTSGVDVLRNEVEVYACFVCSEEYALAAVVLAESVRKTKTSHQVIVFAPQGVIRGKIRALLEIVFDEFIEVAHIYNPNFERSFRERLLPDLMEQYPSWHPHDHQVHLYSKLNVFRLYKFSKIVYLDADTLVLRNIDELFYRPSLSAAPDVVPPDNFNTGVMVIRPSEQVMNTILGSIKHVASYQGGDQGFLNSIFSCWFRMPSNFRLSYVYNVQSKLRSISTATWARLWPHVRVLHFSPVKPWKDPTCKDVKYGDLHQLWWIHYDHLVSRLSATHRRTVDQLVRRMK